jgi:hypothetical protein
MRVFPVGLVVLALLCAACGGDTSNAGDAGPDAGLDAGLDAGPDAGGDAGLDAGADAGLDAGADAGLDAGNDAGPDAGNDAGPDAGNDAGPDAGNDAGPDAGNDAGPDAGDDAGPDAGTDAGFTTQAMPLISVGAPAFASGSTDGNSLPGRANDTNPATNWVSDTVPAWIVYDLSIAPVARRQQVLVAWYDFRIEDYVSPPNSSTLLPASYTIEVNTAAGGTAPPVTGWTQVLSVTNNVNSGREHLVSLGGANWLRMSIAASSGSQVSLDLDVHSAPSGASDAWLFMGDSITFISLPRAFSDLPALVTAQSAGHTPAILVAAIGGSNTVSTYPVGSNTPVSTVSLVDAYLPGFPGRFVTLDYGTNDTVNDFEMEMLVQHVIAAGKIPIVPHMPWSDQRQTTGPQINSMIDALYAKYPQIIRGPDFWQIFLNRTDLIPSGDVHPNNAGQEVYRESWAEMMNTIYAR